MVIKSKKIYLPYVTTLHGTDITLVGRDPAFEPVIRFSLNNSNAITSVSESLKMDTIKINIASAEDRFVNQSLYLVAAKYNIDIAKSNVLQAKAWVNPNISYSQELFDPARNKYFDNKTNNGEVDIQLHQLTGQTHEKLTVLT